MICIELKRFILNRFYYDNGALRYKRYCNKNKANSETKTITSYGYKSVFFEDHAYLVHRLIYLMHHGYLPKILDHIDGNKLNNKIENLRPATNAQNQKNTKKPITNTSGVKGVCWDSWSSKWKCNLYANGKHINVGRFSDFSSAKKAIMIAREKYHGEFCNHG